jgi:hypothetical protein
MAHGRAEARREHGLARSAVQDGEPDEEDPDQERSTPHRSAAKGACRVRPYGQRYRRLRARYTR